MKTKKNIASYKKKTTVVRGVLSFGRRIGTSSEKRQMSVLCCLFQLKVAFGQDLEFFLFDSEERVYDEAKKNFCLHFWKIAFATSTKLYFFTQGALVAVNVKTFIFKSYLTSHILTQTRKLRLFSVPIFLSLLKVHVYFAQQASFRPARLPELTICKRSFRKSNWSNWTSYMSILVKNLHETSN